MTAARETLDRHLPSRGQCGICGIPGLDARHRVIDAVEGQVKAGDDPAEVAAELDLGLFAVHAILDWCRQNPDQRKRGPWLDGAP